jgi:hypothetical protein
MAGAVFRGVLAQGLQTREAFQQPRVCASVTPWGVKRNGEGQSSCSCYWLALSLSLLDGVTPGQHRTFSNRRRAPCLESKFAVVLDLAYTLGATGGKFMMRTDARKEEEMARTFVTEIQLARHDTTTLVVMMSLQ